MAKAEKQISNTANVKALLDRASKLEDEAQEVKDAKKDLMSEVKAAGIKPKEFTVALRIMRNPPTKEFTETVNSYLTTAGQYAFFV